MIFDIKMDGNFNPKSRLVAGEHKTAPPSSITYSSVVTRESVIIAFLIDGLNDLDVCACNIVKCIPQCYLSVKTADQSRIRIWD